jgi:hypothetical protein
MFSERLRPSPTLQSHAAVVKQTLLHFVDYWSPTADLSPKRQTDVIFLLVAQSVALQARCLVRISTRLMKRIRTIDS